jgi:hypothetical protein
LSGSLYFPDHSVPEMPGAYSGDLTRAMPRKAMIVVERRPSVELELLLDQLAELLSLPAGWDSYRASRITPKSVERAAELLHQFLRPNLPPPQIGPTVRGGVQLEWHTRQAEIEIYIEPSGQARFFAESELTGESVEEKLAGNEELLTSWVERTAAS